MNVKADRDLVRAKRVLGNLGRRVQTVRVAADTGIHQSQVSRLLRGRFKRLSTNVRVLLSYAAKPAHYARTNEPSELARSAVVKAVLRTWDCTPEGARALIRLLQSVDRIRRLRALR